MHAYTCVLSEMIVRAPLDVFCSGAFTMSGVDKYLYHLTAHLHLPARVLLISSLNLVNVSGDRIRIRIASVSRSIIPTNWSLLPFQPVSLPPVIFHSYRIRRTIV